jgi:hypothetical protein
MDAAKCHSVWLQVSDSASRQLFDEIMFDPWVICKEFAERALETRTRVRMKRECLATPESEKTRTGDQCSKTPDAPIGRNFQTAIKQSEKTTAGNASGSLNVCQRLVSQI